jgi:hypothetical protein
MKNLIFLCTVHLLEIKIFAYETKLLVSYPMLFLDSNFDYYVVINKKSPPPPHPLVLRWGQNVVFWSILIQRFDFI